MLRPHPTPRTFYSVQYLRGICALMVVFWHGLSQLQRTQPTLGYPGWGAVAVDIFFVISGFVMWHMMMMQPVSFAEYWRKRFARAIPFYWLITSAVVVVMLAAPRLLSSSRFDAAHVIASYFFIPWPHPVLEGEIAPVIIPGWTLVYEIGFYALLGFGLFVPLRWRAAAVIGTICAVALLPAFVTSGMTALVFYTQPIIVDFASGVLIGWALWNGYRLPVWGALGMIAAAIALMIFSPAPDSHFVPATGGYDFMLQRVATCGPEALLIVGGAVLFDCAMPNAPKLRPMIAIGDAAYSIYILHALVLPVVTRVWTQFGLADSPAGNAGYLMLALVACTLAGLTCYRLVELPVFHFFDHMTKNWRIPSAGAQFAENLQFGFRARAR